VIRRRGAERRRVKEQQPAGGAPRVTVIVPAFNEAERITATIEAVRRGLAAEGAGDDAQILVVDDGSSDATAARAATAGARVLRLERNRGKGAALTAGLGAARGRILMLLDADLGASAAECGKLLAPVLSGAADMTLARFPPAPRGGFGLALGLARWGVERLGGRRLEAPLSGQRAFTRAVWDRVGRIAPGYGAEVGLDIDVLRAGFRLVEVPTEMTHKATGRDWAGLRHRGRQLVAIALTLVTRWRR
jgi:glycosyltransferase involved in cell wall biosynthesis